MKYFLLVIILALCGSGYYGYTLLQQEQAKVATDEQAIARLQADNKSLTDDKATLTKNLSDAQAQVTDLTTQLKTAQSSLADTQSKLDAAQKTVSDDEAKIAKAAATAAAAAKVATGAPVDPNSLGTLTTLDGKTYLNCELLRIDPDGITVNHSTETGITKISFVLLSPDLQRKFGYNPAALLSH
jgi:alanyl-tRNA synthetase